MWSTHRDPGVHTLSDLALLDWRTADLLARKVDLAHLFEQLDTGADRLPGATPIGDVIGRAKRGQIAKLHEAGVTTAADARALDRRVGAYSARSAPTDPTSRSAHTTPSVRDLPGSIDMARARLVGASPFLARGLDRVDVLRGDIEVDLDLENSDDGGVYLWGAPRPTVRAAASSIRAIGASSPGMLTWPTASSSSSTSCAVGSRRC